MTLPLSRCHAPCRELASVRETHADGTPAVGQHARDRRLEMNFDAAGLGLARKRVRDRADAAVRMSPDAAPAVNLTEGVVQQRVAGTRHVRARVVADDRVEGEGALQHVGSEPAIEQVARAAGQEGVQGALHLARQAEPAARELEQHGQCAQAGARIRRCQVQHFAQHGDQGVQHRAIRGQAFRIGRREGLQRCLGPGCVVADLERAAVGQRNEIEQRSRPDAQAMLGEAQLAEHLGRQQAHRVARRGVAKAGVEHLGDRGTTHHRTRLEHAHAQTAPCKVAGTDEAVVAGADDDDVGSAWIRDFHGFSAERRSPGALAIN